jgi:hypothetical protein
VSMIGIRGKNAKAWTLPLMVLDIRRDLVFSDEVQLEAIHRGGRLRFILTDHNALGKAYADFAEVSSLVTPLSDVLTNLSSSGNNGRNALLIVRAMTSGSDGDRGPSRGQGSVSLGDGPDAGRGLRVGHGAGRIGMHARRREGGCDVMLQAIRSCASSSLPDAPRLTAVPRPRARPAGPHGGDAAAGGDPGGLGGVGPKGAQGH